MQNITDNEPKKNATKYIYLKGISGFGNRIRSFLEVAFYSLITNRIIIVDWTDGVYAPKGINAFDLFFDSPLVKPTSNPSSLVEDELSVIPHSWQGGVGCNWRERIDFIAWRHEDVKRDDPYSYFIMEPSRIDYIEDVLVWISWTFRWWIFQNHRNSFPLEFKKLSMLEIKRKLMQEYICLKPHIEKKINLFQNINFEKVTVGVHVRYTDNLLPKFVAKRNVIIDDYFPIIDSILEKNQDAQIFLCTDNKLILNVFQEKYGSILSTEKFYPDDNTAIHSSKHCIDKILMGEEALVDMFLLSRCQYLVHTGSSSFTDIPSFLMNQENVISVKVAQPKSIPNFLNRASIATGTRTSKPVTYADNPAQVHPHTLLKDDIHMTTTTKASLINVALNKPATQSSVSRWSKPDEAASAVNGIKSGEQSFHTELEANPWWQVDLGKSYALTSLSIFNRGQKGSPIADRAKSLTVLLSGDQTEWEKIYSGGLSFGGVLDNTPLIVNAQGKIARYVRLQLEEKNYLHLDEVEIYTEAPKTPVSSKKKSSKASKK